MAKLKWHEGADVYVRLNYKEGEDEDSAVLVDLSVNYAVRMDLVVPGTREIVYTFNSEDLDDANELEPGDQPDIVKEATLSNGAGGLGNIVIKLSRHLNLPGGPVFDLANDPDNPSPIFDYDIFLRNTVTDFQGDPIDSGSIQSVPSRTLWA